jgi:hypothetical protein
MSTEIPAKGPKLEKPVAVKVPEDVRNRLEALKPYYNVPEMHRRALVAAIEEAEVRLSHIKKRVG